MSRPPDPAVTELLRFITCGSVDDGKSTLIGRLLYETGQVADDEFAALKADSRGGAIDYSLLVDGLAAEREQAITIDVAYRFFASARRKFIVADTPGHEQYTRNMVTGASSAEAAVVLIDARKGVLTQTKRHSYLARLMGIRRFALAVTKMDLVDYGQAAFAAISDDYRRFADQIGITDWTAIPVSGLGGDNVAARSSAMLWHDGPTLLDYLNSVPLDAAADAAKPFRMPVQWVNRPEPGLPRVRRTDCRRERCGGRRGADPAVGPGDAGRAHRHRRRRPRGSLRGPVGHADPGRRRGLLARRRARRGGRSASIRRPVRGRDRVDGRGRAHPGPRLLAQACNPDRDSDGPAPEV